MSVGLVLVSHSSTLAQGLQELAGQMAADVDIRVAAGTEDGGIGTSYDLIERATEELLASGHEVVILSDLGSATMTVEMLLDFLDDKPVRFVDAPFVEATIAAAVAAQGGGSLEEVARAAAGAIDSFAHPEAKPQDHTAGAAEGYSRTVTVADAAGLHARPAAAIAQLCGDSDTTINGEDADSSLMIMGLGISHGDQVTVAGSDRGVVDRIADAIAAGLD